MTRQDNRHRASRIRGRFGFLGACALIACIPSAGFALGALDRALPATRTAVAQFTPSSVDPRMAALVARASSGHARLMRFTPAGVSDRAGRSVTVAVRIDEQAARAISVHSAIPGGQMLASASAAPELRLTPVPYNLGLARGYQSFAKVAAAPTLPAGAPTAILSRTLSETAIPDLATFKPAPAPRDTARDEASRFVPHNTASEPRAAAAPRAIEPREPAAAQPLDVAGSYRLTRRFDVTAGVRYTQERDRLAPVVDTAKQDSQAVYIGTQFHF